MTDGFAEIKVITSRLDILRQEWQPGLPLPEFEAAFDERLWTQKRLMAAFPEERAPWAYDPTKCPCAGLLDDCVLCKGTGDVCPHCGGAGHTVTGRGELEGCEYCEVLRDVYLKRLVEESSFTQHMSGWTFDQVLAHEPGLHELSQKVEAWAKAAIRSGRGWLFLSSLSGRGKSFFGGCIINLASMLGVEGVYFTAPELAEFLRDRIAPGGRYGTFLEWLTAIKQCPLFVLDEYGAEYDTAFIGSKFRDILEYRSDRTGFKVTVILTNAPAAQLPEWLLSRLHMPEVTWPQGLSELRDIRAMQELGLDTDEDIREL